MQFVKEKATYIDKETRFILDFIRKWEKEHPEEEMVFMTLPKYNLEKRKQVLLVAINNLSKENLRD